MANRRNPACLGAQGLSRQKALAHIAMPPPSFSSEWRQQRTARRRGGFRARGKKRSPSHYRSRVRSNGKINDTVSEAFLKAGHLAWAKGRARRDAPQR
jgi:hypothetical protein